MNDRFGVYFFGRNEWKTLLQIETHLVAKNADSTRASAVSFFCAVFEDML